MSELINKEDMERQITEMWDAHNHITDMAERSLNYEGCAETENSLRKQYQKQEELRDAAPAMLSLIKELLPLVKTTYNMGLKKKITDVISFIKNYES